MSPEVRATYRVQLHKGFTLDDAAAIVPYLAKLGISHLYCSPYLQARSGSTHGYDVQERFLRHRLAVLGLGIFTPFPVSPWSPKIDSVRTDPDR